MREACSNGRSAALQCVPAPQRTERLRGRSGGVYKRLALFPAEG